MCFSVWFRYIAPHPGSDNSQTNDESPFPKTHSDSYLLMHPVYSKDYLESIYPRHKTPTKVRLCYLWLHICQTSCDKYPGGVLFTAICFAMQDVTHLGAIVKETVSRKEILPVGPI